MDGGKGYSGGQEQDWVGCLERDLSLFTLPTETKHWTLAAKKPGEWFSRVEEGAEQYIKRRRSKQQNVERLSYKLRSNLRFR